MSNRPPRTSIDRLITQAADINLYMYVDLEDRIHVIQPDEQVSYSIGDNQSHINGHEVDQDTFHRFFEWLNDDMG